MAPEPAFREHASGLLVPAEQSRQREVWSYKEWQAIERATKFLESHGIQIYLRCNEPACQKTPMKRLRRRDGGITLRCAHKDREVTKL